MCLIVLIKPMKLKILIVIAVLLCQIFLISCTSTPWHRDQADVYLKKGMALLEAGQYLGALKELLEADKNAPNDPVINYHLGIAYLGRGLRDMAMERFQKAVSLKKDYSEAHNYIGTMYMDMGQWEKAIDSFDKALANYLYENPEDALYNSGLAYYNLQKYDMALSRYQQALGKNPLSLRQPQIEGNIGLIYVKQSKLVQAIEHLKKSVTLDPSLYSAHFYLGRDLFKNKRQRECKKILSASREACPAIAFWTKSTRVFTVFEVTHHVQSGQNTCSKQSTTHSCKEFLPFRKNFPAIRSMVSCFPISAIFVICLDSPAVTVF